MITIYESYEIESARRAIMYEASILTMKSSLLEAAITAQQRDLLTEETQESRNRLAEAVQRMIEAIRKLTQKFQHIAATMVARNEKWLASVKTNISPETIRDNYSFTMYPYWTNIREAATMSIPSFRESDSTLLDTLRDATSFKETYFKKLFVNSKEGGTSFDPKGYFRGGADKVNLDKRGLISRHTQMLSFIEGYAETVKRVTESNKQIMEILEQASIKIKSAPLQESNFLLETVMMILEDGKPVTSGEVERDNPDDKDKKTGSNGISARELATTRQTYGQVCYGVNAARMMILEECYDNYVKALSMALVNKVKTKKQD
jgi:hypothetical protein